MVYIFYINYSCIILQEKIDFNHVYYEKITMGDGMILLATVVYRDGKTVIALKMKQILAIM